MTTFIICSNIMHNFIKIRFQNLVKNFRYTRKLGNFHIRPVLRWSLLMEEHQFTNRFCVYLFFKKEYVLFWCCTLIYHYPVCKAVVMIVCGAFCFDCN